MARVAIGGSTGRKETRIFYPPPAHFNKNYKKCDEMAKKRDEMAAGVVFGWKNRGGGSRETIALTETPRRGAAKPQ
jgi:hypothetical protein